MCQVALANSALFLAGVGSGGVAEIDAGVVQVDAPGEGAARVEVEAADGEIESIVEHLARKPQFLAPLPVALVLVEQVVGDGRTV